VRGLIRNDREGDAGEPHALIAHLSQVIMEEVLHQQGGAPGP